MAHKLLYSQTGTMIFLAASLLLLDVGCVIPPPVDVDRSDGGGTGNSPPVLVRRDIYPVFTSTFTHYRKGKPAEFRVAIQDADRQEIVTRFFVDRKWSAFVKEERRVAPGGTDELVFTTTISGLCDEVVNNDLGHHTLEIYISDSGFVDKGDDLRVARPGGVRDFGLWDLVCEELPAGG